MMETGTSTPPDEEDGLSVGTANEPSWGRRNSAGVTIASSLRFDAVGFANGGKPILEDISLRVEPGMILCLLGPSGSGKTTLLKLAAGLLNPTSGRITIDDRVVADSRSSTPPERRGVGLVFQDFALFPHMSIRKNVEFGLTALTRSQARIQAEKMLTRVGMESRADDYPHVLSGGELQRVALARALVPRPGILLMDEPFSGLDSRLRDEMREQSIQLLTETRSTAIIVTHDPEEALRIGDHVALIKRGKLIQEGTGEALYNSPNSLFAAQFFSELNVLPADISDGKMHCALGVLPLPDGTKAADGTQVQIALRLGDIEVRPFGGAAEAVKGHITARRFVGGAEILDVQLDPDGTVLRVKMVAGVPDGSADGVEVSVDPRRIMVFDPDSA